MSQKKFSRCFITGAAGFIGFHLADLLLRQGYTVHGYDGLTDYYDVRLKKQRCDLLGNHEHFSMTVGMLENEALLTKTVDAFEPDIIVHLAAQAGVRYSLENPRAYIDSNIVGTFNVMECARKHKVQHLLMASTSSVYGANEELPFIETEKADTPLTIYAATKKATEAMGHAYAHLHALPTTMFRFFTVYGPWGRPDMAYFKFVDAILNDRPIDIYNHGDMYRDFTFVTDLVRGIQLLIEAVPEQPLQRSAPLIGDSLSAAAPFRVVNIGNSEKIRLMDFIEAIEDRLGKKAIYNFMPMQQGDVPATWANAELLHQLTGYRPETGFQEGISQFVDWYRSHHQN